MGRKKEEKDEGRGGGHGGGNLAGGRDNLQGEDAHVRCSHSAGLKEQKDYIHIVNWTEPPRLGWSTYQLVVEPLKIG